MAGKQTNLPSAAIPKIDAPEDLQQVFDALDAKAEKALEWYRVSQRHKRNGARWTRSVAILLGAFTTIAPSLIAVMPDHVPILGVQVAVVKLNPTATIAGVAAATLILFDKFFGFSSSWMRYAMTFQEIQTHLDEFRINWRKQILRLKANLTQSDDQQLAVYDFLLAFSKSLNESVRAETKQWLMEFKGAIADLDKTIEEQRAAAAALPPPPATGSIQVKLAEVDTLDHRRWSLQLDNRKPEEKEGQSSAALPLLDPGTYKLRVSAVRKGLPVAAELVVEVAPGKVLPLDVKLG